MLKENCPSKGLEFFVIFLLDLHFPVFLIFLSFSYIQRGSFHAFLCFF